MSQCATGPVCVYVCARCVFENAIVGITGWLGTVRQSQEMDCLNDGPDCIKDEWRGARALTSPCRRRGLELTLNISQFPPWLTREAMHNFLDPEYLFNCALRLTQSSDSTSSKRQFIQCQFIIQLRGKCHYICLDRFVSAQWSNQKCLYCHGTWTLRNISSLLRSENIWQTFTGEWTITLTIPESRRVIVSRANP